jgi:hypothetical protein
MLQQDKGAEETVRQRTVELWFRIRSNMDSTSMCMGEEDFQKIVVILVINVTH